MAKPRRAFVIALATLVPLASGKTLFSPAAEEYESLQEAIDRNPGKRVFVGPGDHRISKALRLSTSDSGLWGPGRIVQSDPNADIIDLEGVDRVQLQDVILTRAPGQEETHRPGVRIVRCSDVVMTNVQVIDNRGDLSSVFAAYCRGLQITNCLVLNYSRVAIDDRTTIPFFGYAFNCINGTGIMVRHSTGTNITENRIIERRMLPTRELQQRYQLGRFCKKNPQKGSRISQENWDAEYTNAWHQGAAIQVTKGETTDFVQLRGNYVENAPQGIDIHGDHVIMANNVVNNAFIGMKAMHGSRNVLVIGNQFSRNDLWSIQLQPGTASHAAFSVEEASAPDPQDPEALTWTINRPGANIDGYSIVANNIISDFGFGTAHWMWPSAGSNLSPLQFNIAPTPERSPPETDVIISGNIIYDPAHDGVLGEGGPNVEPSRYKTAVRIQTGTNGPRGLHFSNNMFDPGTDGDGVSNIALPP